MPKQFNPDEIAEILRKHKLWLKGDKDGVFAKLTGADLAGANLSGADLRGTNLFKAGLAGADLRNANLLSASLAAADLSGAILVNANLSGAILVNADLAGADLRDANLRDADLRGAKLHLADLRGAIIQDTQSDDLITACGLGPERRQVIWDMKNDVVFCGCFRGSMAKAEKRAREEYADSPHDLAEALAMIAYFKAVAEVREKARTAEEINIPSQTGGGVYPCQ
jgi:uncharacterized protein YjbI with pentapeptide repeats